MNSVLPITFDAESLINAKIEIPLLSPDPQGYLPLPTAIANSFKGLLAKRARFHACHTRSQKGVYLVHYDIPTGTCTSFVRVQLIGQHERHNFLSCCRVSSTYVDLLLFPAALTLTEQRKILDKLCNEEHNVFKKEGPVDYAQSISLRNTNDRLCSRHVRAPGVIAQSLDTFQSVVHAILHPKQPDYKEDSGSKDHVQKTTLDVLDSNYGPNIRVKELHANHIVHRETHIDRAKDSWVPKRGDKIAAVIAKYHLERYLNNSDKIAIVGVSPEDQYLDRNERARDSTAVQDECIVPVHGDTIVAIALFSIKRFDTTSKKTTKTINWSLMGNLETRTRVPTYIVLKAFSVDYAYDEEVRARHTKPNQQDGIKYRFLASAMQRARKVFGDHDIIYAGSSRSEIKALAHFGFVTAKRYQHNKSILHQIGVLPSTLIYPAISIKCSTWRECVQLVQQRYPDMSYKECLVRAGDFYTKRSRSRSRKRSTTQKIKRSHRAVSVTVGITILTTYYARRYLAPLGIDITQSNIKTIYNTSESGSAQRNAIEAYCNAIRRHLEHSRSTQKVLSAKTGKTWLFRPDLTKKRSGPDRFYLDGLDSTSEPGKTLFTYPFGKRRTPQSLVCK